MLCTDRAGTLADVSQVLHNVSMSPCLHVSLSHYSHCSAAEMETLCFSLRLVQCGRGGDLLGHSDGDVCPAALVLTPLIMSSGQQQPGLASHDIFDQIIVDE